MPEKPHALCRLAPKGVGRRPQNGLLKSIEELYQLSQRQAEVRGLQKQLTDTQTRLNEIRAENPTLNLLPE